MKKNLHTIILILLVSISLHTNAQQRYLNEVFTNVSVTHNVRYGNNWSVFAKYLQGGPIVPDSMLPGSLFGQLVADIYEPVSDTMASRATVIVLHPGSALPLFINSWCTGDKSDSAVAEICRKFAKRGYTAIAPDFRLGWNPISPDQDVRTGGLLQALGRAVQDVKACVRYFRNNALGSNTYHIDPSMIILGGLNTGGTIAVNYEVLQSQAQISIPKFLSGSNNSVYNFSIGTTYFDSTYWGNFDGYGGSPLLNNSGNTPGVSNAVQFVFSLQGAEGDSSWMHNGDAPMVCFHSVTDTTSPYYCGAIYSVGQFVVNVCGGHTIIQEANGFNNNSAFQNNSWTDVYTTTANSRNGGLDGLFPFRPGFGENAPWEWWDSTTCFLAMTAPQPFGFGFTMGYADTVWYNSMGSNPTMSKGKATAYLDTVMGYLNPRIYPYITGVDELSKLENMVSVYPNPATNYFSIHISDASNPVRYLNMYDISGRLIYTEKKINRQTFTVSSKSFDAGMYLLKIGFDKGEVVRKISLQ